MGYETENTRNGEPSGDELGWGLNASTSIAFGTRDKLHLQLAYGEGIASYINDGGNDLAPNDDLDGAEVLPLLGALLYYDHYWNENWSSSIGWSIAEQDTSDGQFGSAYEGARYGNLNLLYYPVPGDHGALCGRGAGFLRDRDFRIYSLRADPYLAYPARHLLDRHRLACHRALCRADAVQS